MRNIRERLESGDHLIVIGETLRYELSYTPEDGIYWLAAGTEKAAYFSVGSLLAALIDCIGSWEPRGSEVAE